MSTKIRIEGQFNDTMVKRVKIALREVPKDETEIIFVINSQGGSRLAFLKIQGFVYLYNKYGKHKITGQLEYGESAALIFFLNCSERQVINKITKSKGIIHLPIDPETREPLDLQDEVVQETISFIKKRTNNMISEDEIIKLQDVPLTPKQMMNFGIATKLVESFDEVIAESV
jgi:ATP-dependent protease ClpP protease subunit